MSFQKKTITLGLFIVLLCGIPTRVEARSVYAIPQHAGASLNVYDVLEGLQEGELGYRATYDLKYYGGAVYEVAGQDLYNRNHSKSFNYLEQFREGCFGIYTTGLGPRNKFCDIHPSIGGFAIMDIALGFVEYFPDLSLCKSRILPELPEIFRNQAVFQTMLSFCHHDINLS